VVSQERFAQGMTVKDYLAQMSLHRDRFVRALDATTITEDDARLLERLGRPKKLLIITEDWCPASLAYVPFVLKLVERDPAIETRVFLRDENPDLMDQYLKRGVHRSIPVFAFFDDQMHELARFLEAKPEVT
jgi:thioredoxin family protein